MDDFKEISPEQAAKELLLRRSARQSLIPFVEYTLPKYKADTFHHKVAEKLEAVERGDIKRLMIFAPPRHGKSQLSTRHFPAWFMARNPEKNVISASYNADLASGFGRNVRDIIDDDAFKRLFPDIGVRSDQRAAADWQLNKGGQYYAVGVGTGTTGKGAHCFLIDDPIKDRKEADSESLRNDHWDWYRDVVYTRLEEDAAIILTLTRWHYDDIAGRLLHLMDEGKGLPWDILMCPAFPETRYTADGEPILLDDGSVPGDALRRKPDEPLAPNRFSYEALKDRQEVLGGRSWSALYQQKPMSEDGGLFDPKWFEKISTPPVRRRRVRAWDLAATTSGDWTVGVRMSQDLEGTFYIEDVIRFRGKPREVEERILRTARDVDGRDVKIVLPQDPGQAGVSQAQNFLRKLAGFSVKIQRQTGSKETRASAFAAQCEGKMVKIVSGRWNEDYLNELATFPLGTHDDQVDASADAFNSFLSRQVLRVYDA